MDSITQAFVDKLKTDPNILDVTVTTPTENMIKEIVSYYDHDPSLFFLFTFNYKNPETSKIVDIHIILHEDTYTDLSAVVVEDYESSLILYAEIDDIERLFFLEPVERKLVQLRNHSLVQSTNISEELRVLSEEVNKLNGVSKTVFYDIFGDDENISFCVITGVTLEHLNSLCPIEFIRCIYENDNMIKFTLNKSQLISNEQIMSILKIRLGIE